MSVMGRLNRGGKNRKKPLPRASSGIRLPRFRWPKIKMPRLGGPRPNRPKAAESWTGDAGNGGPKVRVPGFRISGLRLPAFKLPKVTWPRLRLPKLNLAGIESLKTRFSKAAMPRSPKEKPLVSPKPKAGGNGETRARAVRPSPPPKAAAAKAGAKAGAKTGGGRSILSRLASSAKAGNAPKPPKPAPPPREPRKPLTPEEQKALVRDGLFLLGLMALCGFLFFAGLGSAPLFETDEARYAEIAREMLETPTFQNLVIPRLNYVHYMEKPPLTYWLITLSFALFGVGEFAARLVPAVFGSLTVAMVFLIGRNLWEGRTGFYSGLVLSTSLLFVGLSRILLVDMVMCFSVVLAVFGAWKILNGERGGLWPFWAGAALAFLTKGLLGPGLAGLGAFLFALASGQWKRLFAFLDWRAILMFLALILPWLVSAAWIEADFLKYFFLDEQLGRLATTAHQRFEPFYYFFLVVPLGLIPWVALMPWALVRDWPGWGWNKPENRPWLFTAIWFAAYFVFFTLSRSKMIHYALPMLPPLALLTGRSLSLFLDQGWRRPAPWGARAGLGVLSGLALALGVALLVVPAVVPAFTYRDFGAMLFLGPLAAGLLALAIYLLKRWSGAVVVCPLMMAAAVLAVVWQALPVVGADRSLAGLVKPLAQELKNEDLLVSHGDYFQGIPFYSGKRTAVVRNWGELDYGRRRSPEAHKWFIPGDDEFLRLMEGDQRVVGITEDGRWRNLHDLAQRDHGLPLFEWSRSGDLVVFSNRPGG